MKQISFALFCILFFAQAYFSVAQEFKWAKKITVKTSTSSFPFPPEYWSIDPRITVDNSGNSYIVGNFKDTLVIENNIIISTGKFDVFIAKYTPEGSVEWIKSIKGLGDQEVADIAVDKSGDIYLTGQYQSDTDFQGTALSGSGAFFAKYNNTGSLIWVKQVAPIQGVYPQRIIVSDSDAIFISGALYATAANFGCSILSQDPVRNTKFISRYNSSGTCQWAKSFIAAYLMDFTVDKADNVFVTGGFLDQGIFGSLTIGANFQDIYLAKCDGNGNWIWAYAIGGDGEEQGYDVEMDNAENVILTGFFAKSVNFGNTNLTSTGSADIFLASFNQDGGYNWVQQAGGGQGNQYSFALTVDILGNCIITGSILDITHFGDLTLTPNGERSYFTGYNKDGVSQWVLSPGGNSGDRGVDAANFNGDLYTVGEYYGSGEYTFGETVLNVKQSDIFISKINYGPENVVSGLSENSNEIRSVDVYPNPVESALTISLKKKSAKLMKVLLLDARGETISSFRFTDSLNPAQLDLTNLSGGLYLIDIESDGERFVKKIIKR